VNEDTERFVNGDDRQLYVRDHPGSSRGRLSKGIQIWEGIRDAI
jgi:hypothetical protein